MKNNFALSKVILSATFMLFCIAGMAQTSPKDKKVIYDSKLARTAFVRVDPSMKEMFKKAYAYVIFPNVGKGAIGVGGASGHGIVSLKGKMIGISKMTQVTVGLQIGGQAYREVIFFENKAELDRFKENNFEFSAQVSAIAVKANASANAKYTDGVMIFTQGKGGLMAELSIGGQKFKYKKFWISPLI